MSYLKEGDEFWKIYIEIEQGTCIEESSLGLASFENDREEISFGHKDKNKNSMLDAVIAKLEGMKDE